MNLVCSKGIVRGPHMRYPYLVCESIHSLCTYLVCSLLRRSAHVLHISCLLLLGMVYPCEKGTLSTPYRDGLHLLCSTHNFFSCSRGMCYMYILCIVFALSVPYRDDLQLRSENLENSLGMVHIRPHISCLLPRDGPHTATHILSTL
jgi:hypothetical protein